MRDFQGVLVGTYITHTFFAHLKLWVVESAGRPWRQELAFPLISSSEAQLAIYFLYLLSFCTQPSFCLSASVYGRPGRGGLSAVKGEVKHKGYVHLGVTPSASTSGAGCDLVLALSPTPTPLLAPCLLALIHLFCLHLWPTWKKCPKCLASLESYFTSLCAQC